MYPKNLNSSGTLLLFRCKGNCHGKSVTNLNKILEDLLQLEVIVEDEDLLPEVITYEWSFERLDGSIFTDLSHELTVKGT